MNDVQPRKMKTNMIPNECSTIMDRMSMTLWHLEFQYAPEKTNIAHADYALLVAASNRTNILVCVKRMQRPSGSYSRTRIFTTTQTQLMRMADDKISMVRVLCSVCCPFESVLVCV